MDLKNVQLETERLKMVPVSTKYVDEVFNEYKLPLTQYMFHPDVGTKEELLERTQKWERQLKDGDRLFMAVLLKETGEFLGCFALEELKDKNPEMGGWLKKSAHGNKYGQEAAAALKKWAEEHLEYEYILWPCAKENVGSCKVAESLGGVAAREYEKTNASGYTWDYVEYRIPKKV